MVFRNVHIFGKHPGSIRLGGSVLSETDSGRKRGGRGPPSCFVVVVACLPTTENCPPVSRSAKQEDQKELEELVPTLWVLHCIHGGAWYVDGRLTRSASFSRNAKGSSPYRG